MQVKAWEKADETFTEPQSVCITLKQLVFPVQMLMNFNQAGSYRTCRWIFRGNVKVKDQGAGL